LLLLPPQRTNSPPPAAAAAAADVLLLLVMVVWALGLLPGLLLGLLRQLSGGAAARRPALICPCPPGPCRGGAGSRAGAPVGRPAALRAVRVGWGGRGL